MKRRLRRATTTPSRNYNTLRCCDHCNYRSFRKTQPSWRLREPLTQRRSLLSPPPSPGRCGWGEDLSHYAWCSLPLSASCATLPADLQRNKKVRCSPTPTRISFRSGGGKNHVTRKLSWPWYNWNSFRWCKILQKGGVNTPVNEAGYSEPWQT